MDNSNSNSNAKVERQAAASMLRSWMLDPTMPCVSPHLNIFDSPVPHVLLSDVDEHHYADKAAVLHQSVAAALCRKEPFQLLPPYSRSLQITTINHQPSEARPRGLYGTVHR